MSRCRWHIDETSTPVLVASPFDVRCPTPRLMDKNQPFKTSTVVVLFVALSPKKDIHSKDILRLIHGFTPDLVCGLSTIP